MAGTEARVEDRHRRKVVLVVDDSVEVLTAVRMLLEPKGLDVLQASDPFTGVRLAATFEPDAIVMDLEMPGMDGVEAMRHLKRIEQTRDIPVIAFTGRSTMPAARRRGFERVVPKAGGLENLGTEIADVLRAA